MAGLFPQRHVHDLRTAHFLVTTLAVDAAHILFDRLPDRVSLGMPEHHARRFFLQMEQIKLLGELAVVALLGFLDHAQIILQVIIVGKADAGDALQLRIVGVTAPVNAADADQLERGAELAG